MFDSSTCIRNWKLARNFIYVVYFSFNACIFHASFRCIPHSSFSSFDLSSHWSFLIIHPYHSPSFLSYLSVYLCNRLSYFFWNASVYLSYRLFILTIVVSSIKIVESRKSCSILLEMPWKLSCDLKTFLRIPFEKFIFSSP